MSDLLSLAERCEQATGPELAIDEEIAAALAGAVREVQRDGHTAYHCGTRWVSIGTVAAYTASLDAAMTLVPEGWHLYLTHEMTEQFGFKWFAQFAETAEAPAMSDHPALALCAAALRARAAGPSS